MKRFIVIILSIAMVSSFLMPYGMNAFAEVSFKDIWEQKVQFESTWIEDYHSGEDLPHYYLSFNAHPYYYLSFVVLGYTSISDQLTVEVYDMSPTTRWDADYLATGDLGWIGETQIVHFKEISELIQRECMEPNQYQSGRFEIRSAWRAIIKEYGLTKKEFIDAYSLACAQDTSLQEILNLSDSEYNYHISGILRDISENPMPDFWIDALFWEDEDEAQMLLCKPGATYISSLGYAVTGYDVFSGAFGMEPIEQLLSADLSSIGVEKMIADTEEYLNETGYDRWGYLQKPGLPNSAEMIKMIKTERNAQLKASQTGDGSVNALWVIAFAIPAFAFVTIKRKRRM